MLVTLQIAVGIWLGAMFIAGTVMTYVAVPNWLKKSEAARPLRLWWNA